MGGLFVHFEKKMGKLRENYKFFLKLSQDLSQCISGSGSLLHTGKNHGKIVF